MRSPGLILALVAALTLAACGGDSAPVSEKDRYERRFAKTIEKWEERGERAAPDVPDDAPLSEHAEAAEAGVEMMQGMARDLGRIEPPADVRRAHEDYVRSLQGIAEDMTALVDAMKRNDEAAAERLIEPGPGNFADPENVRLVTSARKEFERLGYDVGLPEMTVGG
jgi:hypothetical protein